MKKYSIMARHFGCDGEIEICQVNAHPEDIVEAAKNKTRRYKSSAGKFCNQNIYEHVYFRENTPK